MRKSTEKILKRSEELIEYWTGQLRGCSPVLTFPFDFQPISNISVHYDRERVRLSPNLSSKVSNISEKGEGSLFSAMLTTFGILMHKYSGDNDINIGTCLHYLDQSAIRPHTGMWDKRVITRLKFEKPESFVGLIRSTDKILNDAIKYQDIPIENIIEIVNHEREADTDRLFQVSFGWGIKPPRIGSKKSKNQ